MYNVTRLLDVAETHRDRIVDELRAAAAAAAPRHWVVAPTLPGSRNGGDILLRLGFATKSEWDCAADCFAAPLTDPAVTRVNGAGFQGTSYRFGAGTVYRALLLRVQPATAQAAIERFEHELASMPRYVPAIRAWQLSRVSDPTGDAAWTHAFEQEFTDVAGLMGPYLMHPIHWAVVDRWFDPETTDTVVRDRVCHSFCTITGPVLA